MAVSPITESDRVQFTELQLENLYTHFRWNNDPELNRLDSELPYREETLGAFKKRFEHLIYHATPENQDFEIHAEDGTLIGVAYVAGISQHNRHCLVGVTIGAQDYWGQGYGRESLELLLRHCFETLEMHRVSTETFEYNDAWRRLVEDAGFQQEGTQRDYLYRDGAFWDKDNYALLRHEYEARCAGQPA